MELLNYPHNTTPISLVKKPSQLITMLCLTFRRRNQPGKLNWESISWNSALGLKCSPSKQTPMDALGAAIISSGRSPDVSLAILPLRVLDITYRRFRTHTPDSQ